MDRALVPSTFHLSSFSPFLSLSLSFTISFAIRGIRRSSRSTFLIPRSFPLLSFPSLSVLPFFSFSSLHEFPSQTRSRGIPSERDMPDYLSPAFRRASCLRPPTRRPDALSYHSIRFSHCHEEHGFSRAWETYIHARFLVDGYEHSSRRVCEKRLTNRHAINKTALRMYPPVWEDVERDKQWGIKSMR